MADEEVDDKEKVFNGEQTNGDDHSEGESLPAEDGIDPPKGSIPLQKRRRVTRACDECRKKKIKCDGKQPCTHCTVYSYECTYDQPSNRRRNPVPAYVEALEHRVQRAEGLIQMIAPNLDLNDPALDIAIRHGYIPGLRSSLPNAPPDASATRHDPRLGRDAVQEKTEADLESMIRAVSEFEMDENGNWDYHGHSSGLSFVRRMREKLGDLMGPDTGSTPFIKNKTAANASVTESPRSMSMESPMDSTGSSTDLPAEEFARQHCTHALSMLSVLLRPVHTPSFWRSFERIYKQPTEQYTNEDHKFLPLLYSAIAVGVVYGPHDFPSYETAIEKGFKYFRTARSLMDLADIRDITSLQAIIFMILFLQSSARLSQCYSYIGVAFRGAIRMGLHRSLPGQKINPLESEIRKRVFWSIRKMDIYVGALLGLPQSLGEEDIDQDLPADVEDEHITEQGIQPTVPGEVTLMTAFNWHTKLISLLSKIVKYIYPIRPKTTAGGTNKSYAVPFAVIREIEKDLEDWKAAMPKQFDPAYDDPKFRRVQQALRLTYAFNQMLLYRPFLHFVGAEKRNKQTDQRAYACAASYINVSRNLIHLCEHMKNSGYLNGGLWFIMYTTFFAILSLVYFAAENPDNPTTQDLMKDAINGRDLLASMSKVTMAADRCTATLDTVFARLPDWMREGKPNPQPKRKRKQADNRQSVPGAQPMSLPKSLPGKLMSESLTNSPAVMPTTSGLPNGSLPNEGAFTPLNVGVASGHFTPSTEYSPTTQTMQQFGLQPANASDELPDFSSMMFSSAEPFTYPAQPLTAFENQQHASSGARNGSMYSTNGLEQNTNAMMPMSQADNLEAQLYHLPPVMMQSNWGGDMPSGNGAGVDPRQRTQAQGQYMITQPNNATQIHRNGQGRSGPGAVQAPQQGMPMWQNAQQGSAAGGSVTAAGAAGGMYDGGFSDINLNEIFGGAEWSGPLMSQGYGR